MKVLIIEDDRSVALNLTKGLTEKGYSVQTAGDGDSGLAKAQTDDYDVLIVDRMLPKRDGLAVIKTLRSQGNHTPALILTALGEVDDTIEGLESGADDYMKKPFVFAELLARLRVLAKRKAAPADTMITIGELRIDKITRQVTREGKVLNLQPREFDLLVYLASNRGENVTRQMLLENVWGLQFDPRTNIVDVHISRLRQKVDKGFRDPMIRTVRGVGYLFDRPVR